MKILFDCSLLTIGGGLQVGLAILKNAAQTRFIEWHVILSEEMMRQLPEETRSYFKSWTCVPSSTRWQRYRLKLELSRLEQSIRPHVAFTIFGPAFWRFHAPHVQGFAIPEIIYPETILPNASIRRKLCDGLIYFLKKHMLRHADYLIVETEIVKQRVQRHLQFPGERVFVVGNSYSAFFRDAISGLPAKIADTCFTFLVPSSYYVHKNLEIIPNVAKLLYKMTMQNFRFILTLPEDTREWKRIKALAYSCGVVSKIDTVGTVDHTSMPNLYRKADAVFLPTLLECSTAVYPESFMAKIPLATSDLDFAFALCHNAALYFNPYDAKSAAEALARLMTDEKIRTELVRRGEEVLRENYPTPEEKWVKQLTCIQRVAELGKVNNRVKGHL